MNVIRAIKSIFSTSKEELVQEQQEIQAMEDQFVSKAVATGMSSAQARLLFQTFSLRGHCHKARGEYSYTSTSIQ